MAAPIARPTTAVRPGIIREAELGRLAAEASTEVDADADAAPADETEEADRDPEEAEDDEPAAALLALPPEAEGDWVGSTFDDPAAAAAEVEVVAS